MALLVTGATGFVGSRFLQSVRRFPPPTDPPILALVRPSSPDLIRIERLLDRPAHAPFAPVRFGHLLDADSLRNAVRGIAQCVHLAADMDFFPDDPGLLVRTNVQGTRSLLIACAAEAKETGTRIRFVYVSSTEAIGPVDRLGGRPANEDDRLAPDCDYGRSKQMAEAVAMSPEFAPFLDVVILRPTGIYGPASEACRERFFMHELAAAVEAGLLLVAPGPLTGLLMISHVDDVVTSIRLALESPVAAGKTYNVAPDQAHSYRDLVITLARVLKRAPPRATVPLPLAQRAVALFSPLLNWGRRRIFLFHPDSLAKTVTLRVYSNERIKGELGYQPRETLSGLVASVEEDIASGFLERRVVSPIVSSIVSLLSMTVFLITRISTAKTVTARVDN
jgi:dihydroflavonol-4-reductase